MNVPRALRGGLAVLALSTLGLLASVAPAQASATASASAPVGYISQADSPGISKSGNTTTFCGLGRIAGYAIDPDNMAAMLTVHVYIDPERDGTSIFYGAFLADQAYPNGHGFVIDHPFNGGNVTVYALGVDSNGGPVPGEAVALGGDTNLACGL